MPLGAFTMCNANSHANRNSSNMLIQEMDQSIYYCRTRLEWKPQTQTGDSLHINSERERS